MKLDRLERYYAFHARIYDWTRPLFLFDREKAVQALDLREGDTVIDLACGTGMNIPFLLRKKARVVGVDYSPAMLESAMKKYPSVEFIRSDVAAFSYGEPVDAVLCTYALSMVEEWETTILAVKRMLRETGAFVILDFHSWQGIARMLYPPFRWWMRIHGVDTERKYVPFLDRHFSHVEARVNKLGYDCIIRARTKRENNNSIQ